MCHCPKAGLSNHNQSSDQNAAQQPELEALKLSKFICRLIREIIATDTECSERLYKDDILLELTQPIKLALEGKPADSNDEGILLDIAETLSNIAATDSGKKFILRGETEFRNDALKKGSTSTSTAAASSTSPAASGGIFETVVTFVRTSLDGTLKRPTSVKVLGAHIFFLRQLYRTCEGLLKLQRYDLHKTLATTVENAKWMKPLKDRPMLIKEWNSISIDNLLNFAGTPKGVLLLQQSGSMEPCVSYMFHRYEKKMQVSKCEKFGYGVLVSQVSTTKPGMQALCKTGLTKSFLSDLWTVLECSQPFGVPDVELDDHSTRKVTVNTLKVFSSFPGLSAVVELERGTEERDTLSYMVRKIVVDAGRERSGDPLVTHEESHQICLRILKLITSSLDSFLLVQSTFHFQESLLRLQEQARVDT
ncbi:hypothetical protein HK104_007239, partial [Borealophlyctis nickersoniae]